jgi:hypothetical protein
MVSAAFKIEDSGGQARVTIMALSGDGGGELPNINRWRKQLGLPPVTSVDDQPVRQIEIGQTPGVRAKLFDFLAPATGSAARQRALVAMLPVQNKTWFFKMTGEEKAVERELHAFEQLILANGPSLASP